MCSLAIVDDSELLRVRIKKLISPIKNLTVVAEAGNSVDAIKMIKEKKPDILLLDIRMPGSNGLDILAKIRKRNKIMKVLILTNYTDDQYKSAAFNFGANYFLDKSNEFQKIPIILKELSQTTTMYKGAV